MTALAFETPLLVTDPTPVNAIDFGRTPQSAAIKRLSQRLEKHIRAPICTLPLALRPEATAMIDRYPGPGRAFIDLFYSPIWSFLEHVKPVRRDKRSRAAWAAAECAHAQSLFLHLWDDHLTDNQITTDVLRLQIRTLAWKTFTAATTELGQLVPASRTKMAHLTESYLVSIHRPPQVSCFEDYCARFVAQAGIWRVAPLAIGQLAGGDHAAARLDAVISYFAAAWRVIDDLQDLDTDLRSGQENAVFHLLQPVERQVWMEARARLGTPAEEAAWSKLWAMIDAGGVADRTCRRIRLLLERGQRTAHEAGWPMLAAELEAAANLER